MLLNYIKGKYDTSLNYIKGKLLVSQSAVISRKPKILNITLRFRVKHKVSCTFSTRENIYNKSNLTFGEIFHLGVTEILPQVSNRVNAVHVLGKPSVR